MASKLAAEVQRQLENVEALVRDLENMKELNEGN